MKDEKNFLGLKRQVKVMEAHRSDLENVINMMLERDWDVHTIHPTQDKDIFLIVFHKGLEVLGG